MNSKGKIKKLVLIAVFGIVGLSCLFLSANANFITKANKVAIVKEIADTYRLGEEVVIEKQGKIFVDGKSTREWDRNALRRDGVSVIYQNYNLFPLLTVTENIQYPLHLKKMKKPEARALAKEVRERVELPESYDNRLPAHLSGGEQQRVAIARTLAQGCKIILADEPTGNLDTANTANIVAILKDLAHTDGCTVIIVTHDPAVAEEADTVLQMKDGSFQ